MATAAGRLNCAHRPGDQIDALPYAAPVGVVQCLSPARNARREAASLPVKMWPQVQATGDADPDEARVPCALLRAVTHCLRRWRTATGTTLWNNGDDAELTSAWRDGLNAPAGGH
ncbi:hypothetical protein GCM10009864_81340 [Streptomyces lunalinharesii]|uniref:Uncharacterized protein n=1 Tax=Streptomyces lunalinharesii TaxID=333384 RepID=A0ABN3T7X8_9ACTN